MATSYNQSGGKWRKINLSGDEGGHTEKLWQMPDGTLMNAPPSQGGHVIDPKTDPLLWKYDRQEDMYKPLFGGGDATRNSNPTDYLYGTAENYQPDKYSDAWNNLVRQQLGLGANDPVPTPDDFEDPSQLDSITNQVSMLAPRTSGAPWEQNLVPMLAAGLVGGAFSGALAPGADVAAASGFGGAGDLGQMFAENLGSDVSLSDVPDFVGSDWSQGLAGTANGGMLPVVQGGANAGMTAGNAAAGPASSSWLPPGLSNLLTPNNLLNAGSSVLSSVLGSNAATDAADTQSDAAKQATALQGQIYGQTRDDLAPWMNQGKMSLGQLGEYTSSPSSMLLKPFGLEDFKESPAYQFNLEEGLKAINKGAASRGKYYAPSTLQDIAKYSQGVASNEFNTAYTQYNTNMNNIWNRLSSLSTGGQNAANQTGSFGQTYATNAGNNITSAGNAQAAGQVGSANAVNNGVGNFYNNYLLNDLLTRNQQPSY